MIIAGIQKTSFVDFPGNIATVIFAGGCNFNCYYCHNRDIIKTNKLRVVYSPELVLIDIKKKEKLLDGVVISGGEPCLQESIIDFAKRIKAETSLKIKLDTNGCFPDVISEMIPFVDFIAMDIKATKEKYSQVAGIEVDLDTIQKSIGIIKNSGKLYEFRTTFCPDLTREDILDIAKWISPCARYALQTYRHPEFDTYYYDKRLDLDMHRPDYIKQTYEEIKPMFDMCLLH